MDERRRSSHGKSSIAIVLGFRTHGVVKSHCAFRHSLRKNLFARVSLFQESTQSIVHSTALKMAPISFAKRWVKPEVRFRLAFSLYVAALRRRLFFGARWSVLGFGSCICILNFRFCSWSSFWSFFYLSCFSREFWSCELRAGTASAVPVEEKDRNRSQRRCFWCAYCMSILEFA